MRMTLKAMFVATLALILMPAKRLFDGKSAVYATASGQLLFIRDGRLMAQNFDPVRLELKGDPLPVANGVTAATVISASTAGPIVYRSPSPDSGKRQLVWVDRSGTGRVRSWTK